MPWLQIPDFGHGVPFRSFIEAHRARQKHADAEALQDAFRTYQIPTTFDGEVPEFAYGKAERRFNVGQRYDIGNGVSAKLTSGLVAENEKRAYLCFHTDDDTAPILTADLTDAELAAYRAHPETFFGRVDRPTVQVENPMDLFDFFLEGYRDTPRLKLLEFMRDAPDLDELRQLPVDELRLVYADRLTRSAMARAAA